MKIDHIEVALTHIQWAVDFIERAPRLTLPLTREETLTSEKMTISDRLVRRGNQAALESLELEINVIIKHFVV